MKLALMALAVEICLARIFVSSWGWAAVIVAIYCIFVYIQQVLLVKKQNKNKPNSASGSIVIRRSVNGSSKSYKQLYGI